MVKIAVYGQEDLTTVTRISEGGMITFPLIGEVEMRYDMEKQRVVYEPVSIEPRTLVPKVIRDDNRYVGGSEQQDSSDA